MLDWHDIGQEHREASILLPLTINILQVVFATCSVNGFLQDAVVNSLLFDHGKQVRNYTIEKLKVILQELGNIDILDSP